MDSVLRGCLEDLERRIDADDEERLLSEWRRFADEVVGAWRGSPLHRIRQPDSAGFKFRGSAVVLCGKAALFRRQPKNKKAATPPFTTTISISFASLHESGGSLRFHLVRKPGYAICSTPCNKNWNIYRRIQILRSGN